MFVPLTHLRQQQRRFCFGVVGHVHVFTPAQGFIGFPLFLRLSARRSLQSLVPCDNHQQMESE